MDTRWWWLASPYVDAYEYAHTEKGNFCPISFEEFKKKMFRQASQWGETGIGSAVLRGLDVPRTGEGDPILAIGRWEEKQWVIIPKPGTKWFEVEYELIIFHWPHYWNVT